jgi:hypothetical protein
VGRYFFSDQFCSGDPFAAIEDDVICDFEERKLSLRTSQVFSQSVRWSITVRFEANFNTSV